ncbi:hypothetical protein GGE12_006743 [Rhizobium mongolense]|uniref:Uncharacterized protein n=1 Tax=Rhizobium mongolense TaxID=57676 RepID=A0A7W6WIE0_9HYPH|nr:hypothetical protein [Rhizobium mongolense]
MTSDLFHIATVITFCIAAVVMLRYFGKLRGK